jgi:hypothetical protein
MTLNHCLSCDPHRSASPSARRPGRRVTDVRPVAEAHPTPEADPAQLRSFSVESPQSSSCRAGSPRRSSSTRLSDHPGSVEARQGVRAADGGRHGPVDRGFRRPVAFTLQTARARLDIVGAFHGDRRWMPWFREAERRERRRVGRRRYLGCNAAMLSRRRSRVANGSQSSTTVIGSVGIDSAAARL